MVEPATASAALFVFAYTRHQLQRMVVVVVGGSLSAVANGFKF